MYSFSSSALIIGKGQLHTQAIAPVRFCLTFANPPSSSDHLGPTE
jgi:hypothetical protein